MRTSTRIACIGICLLVSMAGCIGRTGKIGTPINERYRQELSTLRVGTSTPQDLQAAFGRNVALKDSSFAGGKRVEVWEVFRGGNMDVGDFLLWGQIAHDKDQSILFRFENGRLMSYHSVVHADEE